MLDKKPRSAANSRAASRDHSRAQSRSHSRAQSRGGSRDGSKIASASTSAAGSMSATPRGRGKPGRNVSRNRSNETGADDDENHVRNLKMLPAENILLKGKMHRPISPNRSPTAHTAKLQEDKQPGPTQIREAMDVNDVLTKVNQRLLREGCA